MGRLPLLNVIATSIAISAAVCARADIYVSVDAQGNSHFASQPYDPSYKLYLRSDPAGSDVVAKNHATRPESRKQQTTVEPLIQRAAVKHAVDSHLLRAIIATESSFNSHARSSKGAVGLMQLMPATAIRYGVKDAGDPAQNIEGGTRYLKDLLLRFDGNIALAISAYNAGEGAVEKHALRVPPYRETMLYVPKVITKYQEYRSN